MTTASDICRKAADIVGGDREAQHGPKERNHKNIALMWNAYFRKKGMSAFVTAEDVALMMVLLKVARTNFGSYNSDDYVDMAGYAGCAGELAASAEGVSADED